MKIKPLILILTFLFLFSGSSSAGIFSPDDYYECIFKNMRDVENDLAATLTFSSCWKKFPGELKKGPSGFFGPKNKNDCILKHTKGVKNEYAVIFIQTACELKFGETVEEENKQKVK